MIRMFLSAAIGFQVSFAMVVLPESGNAQIQNRSGFFSKGKKQKERATLRRVFGKKFKGRFVRIRENGNRIFPPQARIQGYPVELAFSRSGKKASGTITAVRVGHIPYWEETRKPLPIEIFETDYQISIRSIRVQLKRGRIRLRGTSSWIYEIEYPDGYSYWEYGSPVQHGIMNGPYQATIRKQGRRWVYSEQFRQDNSADPVVRMRGKIEMR